MTAVINEEAATTVATPPHKELHSLLNNVFLQIQDNGVLWAVKPNVLRDILMRKRFNLDWNDEFLCANVDGTLDFPRICKALIVKYPNNPVKQVAIKFLDHAMKNDPYWAAFGSCIPRTYASLTGRSTSGVDAFNNPPPTNQTEDEYTIDGVNGRDYAWGTCSFSETRYYSDQSVHIPERILEQAADENDTACIVDYVLNEGYDDVTYGGETDSEVTDHDNYETTDSEEFEILNSSADLTEKAERLLARFIARNPRVQGDDE